MPGQRLGNLPTAVDAAGQYEASVALRRLDRRLAELEDTFARIYRNNQATTPLASATGGAGGGVTLVDLNPLSDGSLSTFARSDHHHKLDESISPTWTGLHTWRSTEARTYSFVLTTTSSPPDLGLGLAVENQNSGGGTTLFLKGYSTASEKGHISLYFSRRVNPPNFQQFVIARAPQNRDEFEILFNDENNVSYPMWAISRTGKMFLGRTTGGFLKTGNDVRFYLENVDNTGGGQVGTAFRIKSHSNEFLAIHLQDSDSVGTFNLRNKRSTGEYWMSIVGNASAPAGTVGFFVQSTSDTRRAALERDASGAGHVVVATGASVDVFRLDGAKMAFKLGEATADPGPVADYGWIYTKDVAGTTELFWQNSAGAVVQLTSGSGVASVPFANPTALVGLTPINGTATTAMRSDAAPALDQSIAPTWTAKHTFNAGLSLGPSSAGLIESQVPSAAGNVQFKFQPTVTFSTADNDRYIFDLRRSSGIDELYYRADRLLWTQAGIFTGGMTPSAWGVNVGTRFGNAMFHGVAQDVESPFEVQALNVQLDFAPQAGSGTINPLVAVGGNFEANYRSSAQNTADNVFLKGGRFIARHEKIGRAAETVGGRFECHMKPGDNAGTISGDLVGGQFYMQLTGSFGVNTPNMSVGNLLGYHAVEPVVVGSWGTQTINVACAPMFIEDWGALYQLASASALAHAIIIKSQNGFSSEKGNLFLESGGWNTGHIQFNTGTGASHLFLGNDTSMAPTQAGFAIRTGAPTAADDFDAIFTASRLSFKSGYVVRGALPTGLKLGNSSTDKLGFWGVTPVAQHNSTGETAGFTAGVGATVTHDSTFTGNAGPSAYTISDIVKALKNCGIMAA